MCTCPDGLASIAGNDCRYIRLTHVAAVPSVIAWRVPPSVSHVEVAGEALSGGGGRSSQRAWLLYNYYGPTEVHMRHGGKQVAQIGSLVRVDWAISGGSVSAT